MKKSAKFLIFIGFIVYLILLFIATEAVFILSLLLGLCGLLTWLIISIGSYYLDNEEERKSYKGKNILYNFLRYLDYGKNKENNVH